VDFWDLTKLLFRRWYFAIPVLALTAVASIMTLGSVHPNYIANAYVQLIPPTVSRAQPGTGAAGAATSTRINPWIDLGLGTLANAAMVTLQDKSVLEALNAGGFSDSFTVTLNNSSPMATFEVTGTSEAQASGTAEQVVKQFEKSVADLQSAYGVPQTELITTRRLDLGTNLKTSDSNVKRAVIAVAAVGLLLSVAWTIGLDALIFRRARRRNGTADGDLPTYTGSSDRRPPARNDYRGTAARNQPGQILVTPAMRGFGDRTSADRTSNGSAVSADHEVHEEQMTSDLAGAELRATSNSQDSPDVTIILPLSSQVARGKGSSEGEGKQRR
jgi:hypothetical protein